ncbi:MAG TPA: DMT family transporter [Rectinemataceae bacterium]|nr:DMT family transporter [Rectinemataceae bacterium]
MPVILSLLSALFYGLGDFSGGFATRRNPLLAVVTVSQIGGAALALVFALADGAPFPGLLDSAWAALAGLCGLLGIMMLYRGIARGIVAIVSPLSALVSALMPAAFGLLQGERPSVFALVGAFLCLPAIFLLSWERGGAIDKARRVDSILSGLVAGVGFGAFFIALSRTGHSSGIWPAFIARATSLALLAVAMAAMRRPLRLARGGRLPAVAAGLSDMGANIFFLLASRMGLLSIVSVVSSLFPAPTVVLARIFLKERIPPSRVAGLGLAIAGVALIGM